jgi:hypothetical protein
MGQEQEIRTILLRGRNASDWRTSTRDGQRVWRPSMSFPDRRSGALAELGVDSMDDLVTNVFAKHKDRQIRKPARIFPIRDQRTSGTCFVALYLKRQLRKS